jgi:hypothetical protein
MLQIGCRRGTIKHCCGIRYVGVFIGRPSVKLFRELLGLDWKQCRLVTELLIGHHTLRWHIHVMGLSEITKYRNRRNPLTVYSVSFQH